MAIFASIIVVFIGVFWVMDYVTTPKEVAAPEIDSVALGKIQILEENNRKTTYQNFQKTDTVALFLHEFDPNTADSIELLQLGFKPWMAKNMLKYRAKNGVYRKKESLRKIYGMTDELYAQIEPYVVITLKQDSIAKSDSIPERNWQIKKDTILELNSCDTAELQYLKGIGRYNALQITRYRSQLGGYVSAEQLREIKDLSQETLDYIIPHFIVNTDSIQRIEVNRATAERLSRHPYLSFTQAKAIYELRRSKFKLESIEDLYPLSCLTDEDIDRIKPYLSFE